MGRRRHKPRSKALVKARRNRVKRLALLATQLQEDEAARKQEANPSQDQAPEDTNPTAQPPEAQADQLDGRPRKESQPSVFESYYQYQPKFLHHSEWPAFMSALRRPLPLTFRLNQMAHRRAEVMSCLHMGDHILHPSRPIRDRRGSPIQPPQRLDWCDGWQIGCDKLTVKLGEDPFFRDLQQWLAQHASLGLLIRQELVSMIPAVLLGVQPHHTVLDMCASPGSKTTQLVEALYAPTAADAAAARAAGRRICHAESARSARDRALVGGDEQGLVMANDVSAQRAYTLVRRVAALGSACDRLVVVNHAAQRFPNAQLYKQEAATSAPPQQAASAARYPEGVYDRVLCDVPCSGDGTLRKTPEAWQSWGPEFGIKLHPLQLQIALRGAALCKVGGFLCYSTCTFNPIEDEAVVVEILRRTRGALELVDTTGMLPGLHRRPGMLTWHVMDDSLAHYPTYKDSQRSWVPAVRRRMFRKGMWPPVKEELNKGGLPLERCLRLFPQDQDTGGFFVALFKKVAPLPGPPRKQEGKMAKDAGSSSSSSGDSSSDDDSDGGNDDKTSEKGKAKTKTSKAAESDSSDSSSDESDREAHKAAKSKGKKVATSSDISSSSDESDEDARKKGKTKAKLKSMDKATKKQGKKAEASDSSSSDELSSSDEDRPVKPASKAGSKRKKASRSSSSSSSSDSENEAAPASGPSAIWTPFPAPPPKAPSEVCVDQVYAPVPAEILRSMRDLFGLGKDFDEVASGLVTRSASCQSVFYLAPAVKSFAMAAPGAHRLNVVWSGSKAFERDKRSRFLRLTQDGAALLLPYARRQVLTLPPQDMRRLLQCRGKAVPLCDLHEETAMEAVHLQHGNCILLLHGDEAGGDAAPVVLAGVLASIDSSSSGGGEAGGEGKEKAGKKRPRRRAQQLKAAAAAVEDDESRVYSRTLSVRFSFARGREHAPRALARNLLSRVEQMLR